ncbi:hypothetical protein E2P81_ATG04959 [Venturia nashicola]|nr:hypothetical protein E2P81_ATG04959 [Venturia nashicola]
MQAQTQQDAAVTKTALATAFPPLYCWSFINSQSFASSGSRCISCRDGEDAGGPETPDPTRVQPKGVAQLSIYINKTGHHEDMARGDSETFQPLSDPVTSKEVCTLNVLTSAAPSHDVLGCTASIPYHYLPQAWRTASFRGIQLQKIEILTNGVAFFVID